jgi:hypothetical protein
MEEKTKSNTNPRWRRPESTAKKEREICCPRRKGKPQKKAQA